MLDIKYNVSGEKEQPEPKQAGGLSIVYGSPETDSFQMGIPVRDGTGTELESRAVDAPVEGEARALHGFREYSQMRENESYLGNITSWIAKKTHPEAAQIEADKIARENSHKYVSAQTEAAMDKLDQMTEQGLDVTPEFAQLEQQVSQMIQNDQEPEKETSLSIGLLKEAVTRDPGAALAELSHALIEDPEFLLIGYGGAAKLGTAMAKIAGSTTKAAKTAKTAGTIGGAAATDATLMAGAEAIRDIDTKGKVDPENIKRAAAMGAVGGAVLGAGISGYSAVVNRIATKTNQPVEVVQKQLDNTIDDMVEATVQKAENVGKEVDLVKVINKSVGVKRPLTPKDISKRKSEIRKAVRDAEKPTGQTGESNLAFYERVARDADASRSSKIDAAREIELTNKHKIQEEKESMWQMKEDQHQADVQGAAKGMIDAKERLAREVREVQDLIGSTIDITPPNGILAKAMNEAAQSNNNSAIAKEIFARNGRLNKVREAGNIDPKLLGVMGATGVGALGTYAMWDTEYKDEFLAATFAIGALPFGVKVLRGATNIAEAGLAKAVIDTGVSKGYNYILEPISSTVKKISKPVWGLLRKGEQQLASRSQKYAGTLKEFSDSMGSIDKSVVAVGTQFRGTAGKLTTKDTLWMHMLNSNSAEIKAMLKTMPDLVEPYAKYRKTLDELRNRQLDVGKKIGFIEDYSPRYAKDVEKILEFMGKEDKAYLTRIIDKEIAKLGRGLTDAEHTKLLQGFFSGSSKFAPKKLTSAHAKHRSTIKVTPEMLPYYMSPEEAIVKYVGDSLNELHWRELIGKRASSKYGDNMSEGIASLVRKQGLDPDAAQELRQILEIRFDADNKHMNRHLAALKNLTQASLIGNTHSALTQIGDTFLSGWKNGAVNTMTEIANGMVGNLKLSARDMGVIRHVAQEMTQSHKGYSSKLLEKSFSTFGFKQVDELGKTYFINASFRKWTKRAKNNPDKIHRQWDEVLGPEEVSRTIDDLANKRVTDRTKFLASSDLSDMQPLTMLEMPKAWLSHPNARLAYTLQTFTMKFLNQAREAFYENWKAGDKAQAFGALGALYVANATGSLTAEHLKNYVFQKGRATDEIYTEALLKGTGLFNRYYMRELSMAKDPVTTFVASTVTPPAAVLDGPARALMDLAQYGEVKTRTKDQLIRMIPGIGMPLYYMGAGGIEAEVAFGDLKDYTHTYDFSNLDSYDTNYGDYVE